MRKLTLYRERALACFALKYHYFIGQDFSSVKDDIENDKNAMETWLDDPNALRNGETRSITLPDEDTSLVIAVITQERVLYSNVLLLPAADGDISVRIVTDFNGDHRLRIYIESF